jgi:hypothetical protein
MNRSRLCTAYQPRRQVARREADKADTPLRMVKGRAAMRAAIIVIGLLDAPAATIVAVGSYD